MTIVVDASALIDLAFGTPDVSAAIEEALAAQEVHAPSHIDAELGGALRGLERAGAAAPHVAADALQSLPALIDLRHEPDRHLMAAAWRLRQGLSFYDALYVALAAALDCPLLTRDARLASAGSLPCLIEGIEPHRTSRGPAIPVDLNVRRFAPGDLPAVKALHYAALRAAGTDAGPGPWDDDLDDIEGVYVSTGGEFLVGEAGGQVIAMGAIRPLDATTGQVKRMRTLPAWQGRGIGRAMLDALEDAARSRGWRTLVLDTAVGSEAAIRLYTAAGYRQTGTDTIAGLPSLLFAKPLA